MEIAAIIFLIVMFGVAYVAFRLLKRTMKMIFRVFVVWLIIVIALIGGAALWNMESLGFGAKQPESKKSR